jgi:hypothetical protein
MSQQQVDGCNAILAAWDAQTEAIDKRWPASMSFLSCPIIVPHD